MKELEYGNEPENENDDEYREDSYDLNHSEEASPQEIEGLIERSLQKIHSWHDMSVGYVYLKEKIVGKKGKTGKKNKYEWIETNDVYIGMPERVKGDRDYWISAAETRTQITDKSGTPVLREKWVVSVRCHFIVLSLEAASRELGLDLTSEQLKRLVLEHCNQRGQPYPIIWEDGEELTLVWALDKPYDRVEENYYYDPKTDMWCEDEYTFNPDWKRIQSWLYEDFKYLGANGKKKHILTMLRVPGTLNTHTNKYVRIVNDSEEISLSELTYGLDYVRERLRRYEPIVPPDLSKLLQEYKAFWEFCAELDKVICEPEPKRKPRKAKPAASRRKAPKTTKKEAGLSSSEARKSSEGIESAGPEARQKDLEEFLAQLRRDVLLLHPVSEKYVCLGLKKNEKWKHIWVQAKDLEEKLTELWLRPDFSSYDIFDSQAEYLRAGNREVSEVYSVRLSFLDLDRKYAEGHEDLSPEDWVRLILAHCEAHGIPVPTIMLLSGNGIHLKWVYKDAVSGTQLKDWERLEKKLHKLFAEFGSDMKSTDLARVLRVPGTRNCKPETQDRTVRVVNYTSETYEFEEFLALIDRLVPSETEESQSEPEPALLDLAIELADESPAFYVKNETVGTLERVKKHEMGKYLGRQDRRHVLRRSIAEFAGGDLERAYPERMYCNYVKLLTSKVPGATFEDKVTAILEHCHNYRGVGFPEANGILEYGDALIVIWKYISSDELPGRALSRWKRTEEDICEYFADWGAKDDADYQDVRGLLPIAGFRGEAKGIWQSSVGYTFDALARKVLPYTQAEVKEYEAKKAEAKAERDANRPLKRKPVSKGQKRGNFSRMAERRFGDIWNLICLRKDKRGEVPQGH